MGLEGFRAFSGGPQNKEYSLLGSIYWGPPVFGNYHVDPATNTRQCGLQDLFGPMLLVYPGEGEE